jgi:hypothetical protein
MKNLLLGLGIFIASTAFADASGGWKVIAHKSVSGEFAVTAVNASANHPRGLEVRLIGHVQSGNAVVACSKGYSVSSNSREYSHSGTFGLPMTRGADSCDITASVGGSGKVTVQILKR